MGMDFAKLPAGPGDWEQRQKPSSTAIPSSMVNADGIRANDAVVHTGQSGRIGCSRQGILALARAALSKGVSSSQGLPWNKRPTDRTLLF